MERRKGTAEPVSARCTMFIAGARREQGKRLKGNKPLSEGQAGEIRDRDGRLVRKTRLIDRERDVYYEHVEDAETGEVLRDCREPLSQHVGRGSARNKRGVGS
jgi:hypothetical protein